MQARFREEQLNFSWIVNQLSLWSSVFVLLFAWRPLVNRLYPPIPVPPPPASHRRDQSGCHRDQPARNAIRRNQSAVATGAFTAAPEFVVNTEIPEQLLVVTNDNARYTFTSRGGGLKEVELLHYPETVSSHRRKTPPTNDLATLNTPSGPPVFAILGDKSLQGDGVFKLTQIAGGRAGGKNPHQRPDVDQGFPARHELSGHRFGAVGEPIEATARHAGAGMDDRHRHADGAAGQRPGDDGDVV